MDDEARQHQEDLLRTHQRRLRELERLEALKGVDLEPHIRIELDDLRMTVARLQAELGSNAPAATAARTIAGPPPPSPAPRRANLPAQANAFIGREQHVAAVCAVLRREQVRIVTLTGPGGVGKSRLGIKVAHELLNDVTDGVWFVDFAPIADVRLVLPTIIQTLGVRDTGDKPLIELLTSYLSDRHLLLLLDNFEHVIDAAPQLGELLMAAPALKILITSREVLHIYGENEVSLPPLGLPEPAPLLSADHVLQSDAVRLFVDRAQAARADFKLTDTNAAAVAGICAQLDGLPLALELAAARIKFFSPAALLSRLDGRLNILTGGARDLPARQQTLRHAIDWSYDLLNRGEQTLFARLAVFVGGCTLAGAEAVCNATGDVPMDVLDGLVSLTEKSLLSRSEEIADEPRFRMLETIREYALDRLDVSGQGEAIRRQHAVYYVTLAELAEPNLHRTAQKLWFDRLDLEHSNVRAALAWSQRSATDSELGLRMAAALWWFWYLRGHVGEGLRWLVQILTTAPTDSSALRARVLNAAGWLASYTGDREVAQSYYQEGQTISAALENRATMAYALRGLGSIALRQSQYSQAARYLEDALALFQVNGDTWGDASTRIDLGNVYERQGHTQRAVEQYHTSLALCRKLGDHQGTAHALGQLGGVAEEQGDFLHAQMFGEERLALYRDLHILGGVANTLNQLGDLARHQGANMRAEAMYRESLALARDLGDRHSIMTAAHNLAHIRQRQGDVEQAKALFTESLDLAQTVGEPADVALCLAGFAGLAAVQQQPLRAARLFGAAERLLESSGEHLDAVDRIDYDRNIAMARDQIETAPFAAAWAEGRLLSLDQAIAEALGSEG